MKKIQKWKVLDSTYIIQRPWLTARCDKVELPDGTVHPEYYVLEYPVWVNVIAITADGRFVMVEQYRHGLREVFTELVAGVSEKGETPLESARRELLEETGYGRGEWQQFTVLSQNPARLIILHIHTSPQMWRKLPASISTKRRISPSDCFLRQK